MPTFRSTHTIDRSPKLALMSKKPDPPVRRIVRMKDIADRGEVSLATVSRVLRGGAGVDRFSDETRERVLRVAQELGWTPNRLVQSIQAGRTSTVGLMMYPFGQHWQEVMLGLQMELLRRDVVPITLYPEYNKQTDDGQGNEIGNLKQFMERRVDGIVVWPVLNPAALDYLVNVCAAQVPIVTIDFELPASCRSVAIRTREETGMQLAIDHLVDLGHKHFGFVVPRTTSSWAGRRKNAFVEELAKHKLTPTFIEEIDKDDRSALSRLREDFQRATAIIAASEQLALGCWLAAREMDMRVPEDISILGFGELRFEYAFEPKLSSIDQRPEMIGQEAARMVLDADARQLQADVPYVDVEPILFKGETTGPPARAPAH